MSPDAARVGTPCGAFPSVHETPEAPLPLSVKLRAVTLGVHASESSRYFAPRNYFIVPLCLTAHNQTRHVVSEICSGDFVKKPVAQISFSVVFSIALLSAAGLPAQTPNRANGTGIGAQYGARDPSTCKSRTAAPTAGTVKQYVHCGMEGVDMGGNLVLLTNVAVQMASPRAFQYREDSAKNKIDVRAPVIDIRGGYKLYQCGKPTLSVAMGVVTTTPGSCTSYDQPVAEGSCYKDTFGDWNCYLVGNRPASSSQVTGQKAPTGY